MPSTYTTNLRLEKPATGEQAGNWGDTANHSYDFLDTGIDGSFTIPLSAVGYTLETFDGVDSPGRNKVLVFTGTLGGTGTINISPTTAKKIYFVTNKTTGGSGGFALNFVQGGGTPFVLQNGRSAVIYTDGAGAVTGALANLQVDNLLVQTALVVNGSLTAGSISGVTTFAAMANFNGGVTIAAPCTVNLGGDAAYDLYYRSPAGPMARLARGADGTLLGAVSGALAWTTVGMSVGAPVAGAAANGVFYADATSHLAQSGNLSFVPATGLGLGMAPQVGGLNLGRGLPATILMESLLAAGVPNPRTIVFTSNLTARWRLSVDGSTESGGNVGSNFKLQSFDDPSTTTLDIFTSFRSGRSVFGNSVDAYNAQLAIQNSGNVAQDALTVWGRIGQTGKLQTWKNSSGTVVASMDNAGNLVVNSVTGGGVGGGLALDAQGRLTIGSNIVAGAPLGTLHIGRDTGSGANCSVAMDKASTLGAALPVDMGRVFFYRAASGFLFVIEYSNGGNRWCTYVPLTAVAGNAPPWVVNTTPV